MAGLFAFIPERFRSAWSLLLTAFDYALDSHVDRWQFAVALTELQSSGATLADIRWLLLRGLAEHAKETTVPGDHQRSFRPLVPTSFPADTCLVLSADGAAALRNALGQQSGQIAPQDYPDRTEPTQPIVEPPQQAAPRLTPEWDDTRRELRYDGQVIKRYRVPAQNQALILAAFQEEGWPEFIDDPLPPEGEQDPKQRLQATVKSLNRNQLVPLVRFHGNGNGLRVYWDIVQSE
jgi:hypothetical protein